MPKKTLALIVCLVLVTVVLFVIALKTGTKSATQQPEQTAQTAPASIAHSVLSLSPNPVTVVSGQQGSVSVMLAPSDNPVTAVQLEIGYDPTLITNLKITPSSSFSNPVVLIDKNNPQTGRYTYAVGISPSSQHITANGAVATLTFTAKTAPVGQQMQLALLPTSLVTARGVATSVLKEAMGTLVTFSTAGSTTQTAPVVTTGSTKPASTRY